MKYWLIVVVLSILIFGCTKKTEIEYDISAIEKGIFDEVNNERARNNLNILTYNDEFSNVARKHSEDMILRNYLDHINPEGERSLDRVKKEGLIYGSSVSENIHQEKRTAKTFPFLSTTPNEIGITSVESWLQSTEGHRENMLDPKWDMTGVGIAISDNEEDGKYKIIVTQLFMCSQENINRFEELKGEIQEVQKSIEELDKEMVPLADRIDNKKVLDRFANDLKQEYNVLNDKRSELVNTHNVLTEEQNKYLNCGKT